MESREEGCQTLLDPLLYCSWLCNKLFRYLKHNGKHTNVPFIWRFLQTEEIECNLDPATWGGVEKVAAHDVVRIFPGKSRGREHSLCAGLISIGTVAICREKTKDDKDTKTCMLKAFTEKYSLICFYNMVLDTLRYLFSKG